MHCPSCSFENPEVMKFCVKCATPLSPIVPSVALRTHPGLFSAASVLPRSQGRLQPPNPSR
jgi:hypothetical protein